MEATKMDYDRNGPLSSLLVSCTNIRKRSRCWRTLSSSLSERKRRDLLATSSSGGGTEGDIPVHSSNNDTVIRRLREEQQTAAILDRRIWEYQLAIERLKHRQKRSLGQSEAAAADSTTVDEGARSRNTSNNGSGLTAKELSMQQRILRSKVMDEIWRKHKERLLLSRMAMSQPAVRVANAAASTSCPNDPTVTLVQEALRCRNRLVTKTLKIQREIGDIKRDLRDAHVRGMQLQESNREAWIKLQELRQKQDDESGSNEILENSNTDNGTQGQKLQRLARENVILKRVLADIIARLDWSDDERLQEILLRLE